MDTIIYDAYDVTSNEMLIYDEWAGTFYYADEDKVEEARKKVKETLGECRCDYISLDDFYQAMEIERSLWQRAIDKLKGWIIKK